MILGLPIFIILLPLILQSKSTCEDEEYFSDSYGWTCRDYDRAPEHCERSTEYEKNGKIALTSCCACRNTHTKHDISEDIWLRSPAHFDTRRRQADTCIGGCTTEFGRCEGYCNTDQNTCKLRCNDVNVACAAQCEDVAPAPTQEPADPDAIVDTEPTEPATTSKGLDIWMYILIAAIVLLCLICCCIIVFCLMRTKETDVDCPTDVCAEEVPMVENDCAQPIGDCYQPVPQQYAQCGGYTTTAPIQNRPIYS